VPSSSNARMPEPAGTLGDTADPREVVELAPHQVAVLPVPGLQVAGDHARLVVDPVDPSGQESSLPGSQCVGTPPMTEQPWPLSQLTTSR
jgi:hypothetical protein